MKNNHVPQANSREDIFLGRNSSRKSNKRKRILKVDPSQLRIIDATSEQAEDWTKVFVKGIRNFRWINKYLREQNITELDIKLSFQQDIQQKLENELFLIAYYRTIPIGIIRFDKYFFSSGIKILSHFPLVVPRFQGKGIGSKLVQVGISKARKKGFKNIWAECWSKDQRELAIYTSFYLKNGFRIKSKRFEMKCSLQKFNLSSAMTGSKLETVTRNDLTKEFIETLSHSYAQSTDQLHKIEQLSNFENCKEFLENTESDFEKEGYEVKYTLARFEGKPCGALMTADSSHRGFVLEIGILPEFRRKKIAQTMLIDYILKVKNHGCDEVILAVDELNEGAISLYKKIGFRKTWYGIMLLYENDD
ncbi:MAG: hypothetical protein DRP02_11300 [Candidatus Gerdarchaeota archaeon]|nr:MAG: hypothetical protein DRP02_11300 [Candidatus Gerdarchaeota archaeon]